MAMSANAVLMKFFKLPPAMRMILAVAGFGSLASILFMLLPALRTREGKVWVLIIGGIGLLLFLLIWGIRRMFFKKKSTQLSDALESQGPSRGDIAEQEKIYREKFRAKLADLKTNGLNVYKLPWFVLMGEPGCGKTASLIHSGLDFPLGKDEVPGFGGTRNYNWWFTNEAVILDTAGRIAFQEEGTTDRTEWEYFLKLLKLNRPRCPVNGLVIALPADKLLRDNAEERTQKATILRERLRQVHQSLGVRFPTFVLVTKMDLAGGFSEFFEEIRVDLHQRNQMFGWSRPGEFSDTYDPATFPGAFDQVYRRIRDWGMRYLQRKATEEELGMVVTFPESFRQLRDPLNDYISTIFQKSPLLEPPFFRGFYFTSAVQEGAPIFDVFSKSKAGISVQERQTRAVDSKAFFIHDLYSNKVFPENGLVFRSAKHVSLNKRMRRVVWVGSAAMILLMATLFFFGQSGTHDLLEAPHKTCKDAVDAVEKNNAKYEELNANLRIAKDLRENYERYSQPWTGLYARLLFIGADITVPQDAVGQIHARFVLDCIFRPVLTQVERNLVEASITIATPPQKRERYLAALEVYTKWYGEVVGQHELAELDGQRASVRRSEFETLLAFLETPAADFKDASEQFETALATLSEHSRSFAMEILRDNIPFNAEGEVAEREAVFDSARTTEVILAAVEKITNSWMPYTQLTADNTNPKVKYWADFAARVGDLRDRFDELLSLAVNFEDANMYADSVEQFMRLTAGVEYLNNPDIATAEPGSLHEAFYNLMVFLDSTQVPETAEHKIIRFAGLLEVFREQWGREYDAVREALMVGAPESDHEPQSAIYDALANDQVNLEKAFNGSLTKIRERLGLPKGEEPLAFYANQNLITLDEADPPPPREEPARILRARDVLGRGEHLKNYLIELRAMVGGAQEELQALEDLSRWPDLLQGLGAAEPAGKLLNMWFSSVENAPSADSGARNDIIKSKSGLADNPFWRPVDLYRLADNMWQARRNNSTGFLLSRMARKAEATLQADQMPGLARLMPGFDQPSTLPFNVHRYNQARETPPAAPEADAAPEAENADDDGLGRLSRGRRAEPKPVETDLAREQLKRKETSALLYDYHTLKFMINALRQFELTRAALGRSPGGEAVLTPLAKSADMYVENYFGDWYDLYSDPTRLLDEDTLGFMEKCRDAQLSWPEYVALMQDVGGGFATASADRMEALIREVVMFDINLSENEVDDAIYERLARQLSKLNSENRSLPYRLKAMRDRRNAPDRNDGDREVAYSQRLEYAWQEYRKSVREIGALTDDARGAAEQPEPPNLEKLAEEIVYKQATTTDMPLIAPLMDIADYGQRLLVHHLDAKLTELFAAHAGKYPLLHLEDARDDTALLTGVAERNAMDPRAFVELLRQTAEFQKKYGQLYRQVRDENSPSYRTLYLCNAWIKFLYPSPDALLRGEEPRPLDVWVAIVKDSSGTVQNAGSVYSKLTVVLPLLTMHGAAAPPIELATRAGEGIQAGSVQQAIGANPAEYRWSLFVPGNISFGRMTAAVSDRHPDARREYAERIDGWSLPGTPWKLLMAMGARDTNNLRDGYWQIPVRMETSIDPIGFGVGLKIGGGERQFPGVIPPLENPGPRPGMRNAEKYLPGQ